MINNRNKNITSQVKNDRISRRKGSIPILLSAVTNNAGDKVEMTFNTKMKSPVGKEGEFKLYDAVPMTNQKWNNGYPDSPELLSTYHYQSIFYLSNNTTTYLLCSGQPQFIKTIGVTKYASVISSPIKLYKLVSTSWVLEMEFGSHSTGEVQSFTNMYQLNNDIYTDSSLTSIYFEKTTNDFIATPINLSGLALGTDTKKIVASVNVDTGYQKWEGYKESIELTNDFSYQLIYKDVENNVYLITSNYPIIYTGNSLTLKGNIKRHSYGFTWTVINSWDNISSYTGMFNGTYTLLQANNPVYTDSTLTNILFAKTTPDISTAITNGQVIKLDYTQGTVASSEGDKLKSFSGVVVENVVLNIDRFLSESPMNFTTYPYQLTSKDVDYRFIFGSTTKYYTTSTNVITNSGVRKYKKAISGSEWIDCGTYSPLTEFTNKNGIIESNSDIYIDSTLTTIFFEKNTI